MPRARSPRCGPLRTDPRIALGAGLLALAVLPPMAGWLEASLVRHLLGQYPLLVGGGALIGAALARRGRAGWSAAPALLAGVLAMAFWLIPRWIDAAVADPATDAAKAVSLVVLAGFPIGWGWRQAGPVLRGFAAANAATMLAVMGWLQLAVPSRLCNSYLIGEQVLLGRMLLLLAMAIVATAIGAALTGGVQAPRPRAGRPIRRNSPATPGQAVSAAETSISGIGLRDPRPVARTNW